MIPSRELKDIDDMNSSMDNMNNFGSRTQGSRCYEKFRVVDEMNDYGS